MTVIWNIILIFLLPINAQSWKETSDSLQTILAGEQTDSGKIALSLELFDVLLRNQPDRAFEYATKAREIAEERNDTGYIVRSILKQCDFYSQIGEHNTAIELAYEALNIADNNYKLLSLCHNRIATVHSDVGNFTETLEHNKSAFLQASLGYS